MSAAGQIAGHNAETAAARGRNNAKVKANYHKQKEYEITANLDNVKYLSDVQEQDIEQDAIYAAMMDQWSQTDFQLKKLFDTQDFEIEDAIIAMHKSGGYSEQTGASAARASVGKDVMELGKAKTRAIHTKMMAVKEANISKETTHRKAKYDSRKLFMEVAFAPVHGFAPPQDTNFESGPSKAGLLLGLGSTAFNTAQAGMSNKANPGTAWYDRKTAS